MASSSVLKHYPLKLLLKHFLHGFYTLFLYQNNTKKMPPYTENPLSLDAIFRARSYRKRPQWGSYRLYQKLYIKENGGDDRTRTGDLLRDRQAF